RYPGATYEFVGFFDDAENVESARPTDPRTGSWAVFPSSDLITLQATSGLDQIVLANPEQMSGLLHTLSICHERGVQITPMFALYQDLTGRVPVSHLGRDWYVALPANVKETTRTFLLFKRLLDISLALLGLGLALPLMPIV